MPKIIGKINSKACLKIKIYKEFIFKVQLPKMKNISARDGVGTMMPNKIISKACLKKLVKSLYSVYNCLKS